MDRPACPLCGGCDSALRFEDKGYEVRQCTRCELFFIDPYPADVDGQHARVRQDDYGDIETLGSQRNYRYEVQFYGRHFAAIESACGRATSVLDVGCGTGHLLELFGRTHPRMRRAGIELNAARAAVARERSGCTIYEVPVEEFATDEPFDAITFINVLSHIPSFEALFASFRRLLKPEGRLVLRAGEQEKDIRKGDVFDWGIPAHLHFLGMGTMAFAADKFGFDILQHTRLPYAAELFSPGRWKAPGRSTMRNVVKRVVAATPLALTFLRRRYERRHGRRIYVSLMVLRPRP